MVHFIFFNFFFFLRVNRRTSSESTVTAVMAFVFLLFRFGGMKSTLKCYSAENAEMHATLFIDCDEFVFDTLDAI